MRSNGPHEPFGYKRNDAGELEPIPEEIEALRKADYYIASGCSMQAARDYIIKKTGRSISVPGLLKAIKYDPTKKDSHSR